MVHYDEKHIGSILGSEKEREYVEIQKEDFDRKLTVSVKEGSTIPHDALTEANQSIDMATAGLIDPITMFEKLDYPNPKQAAEKLYTWQNAPQLLFPDVSEASRVEQQTQQMEQLAMAQGGMPAGAMPEQAMQPEGQMPPEAGIPPQAPEGQAPLQ